MILIGTIDGVVDHQTRGRRLTVPFSRRFEGSGGAVELHEYRRDVWTTERHVRGADGVVGTRLVHLYSLPWGAELSNYSLGRGEAMPDRPGSGEGALATIDEVGRGVKDGTGRRIFKVVGFEARGRS